MSHSNAEPTPSTPPMDLLPPEPGHHLPSNPPGFRGVIADTYAESTPDWPPPTRPPAGAPNIVVIMVDDLGFGQLSCFGGPIEAPHLNDLALHGLRYNNFHTTALCSPSRAALLTGRNHHSVGFATIAEMASGFPGANSFLPKSAASIAEVLRQTGYSTYCAGKWHLTPTSEQTAAGPFDRWPLGLGFERFYGFLPGEVDQWHPMLTVDNHRIETPTDGRKNQDGTTSDYHVSEDIVDASIRMLRDQQQVASGRPFFLYLPFGAPHCPFHAPPEYIDHYAGRFDDGWDVHRQATYERQLEMDIIPAGTDLPPRNRAVPAWDSLDTDAQRLYARLQETFCGFVDHTDAQIGRLMDALRELDVFDDTAVIFLSDNGASAEGGKHGTTNTERFRNLMFMEVDEMLDDIDHMGSRHTDPHYPIGWSQAGNAPFQRWKRDTHRGGNTDPMIVHWPGGISPQDHGSIRSQYHHITDLFPTLLDLAGLPVPTRVNGVDQQPLEGHSFAATIADGFAPQARTTQYYEMLGSRAIWHDGWTAVTWHKPGTDWADDPWELYHQDEDYSQAHDLAAEQPERLAELVELWWDEAREHNVLPLDDRGRERFIDPTRPAASEDRDVYRYSPGTSPIPNPSLPAILNAPHSITARLTLRSAGDEGVLVSQGGELAGWVLFIQEGRAHYVHNVLKIEMTEVTSAELLPVGPEIELAVHYEPIEQGWGRAVMTVDGVEVGVNERMRITPMGYSMVQEGFTIGRSWGTPVASANYRGAFEFAGDLRVVEMRTDPSGQVWTPRADWKMV